MSNRRSAAVTLSAVNAMQPGDIINDTSLKGFGARRQKDAISYFLKTRVNGRQRWFTIGRHGSPWTPDSARKRARSILVDPSIADQAAADAPLTFSAASQQFLASHGPKLKPTTLVDYRHIVETRLLPAFGKMRIDVITRGHISNAHASWHQNPRSANYALAVVSKLMTWAEDQGYRSANSNPCRRVQRYKENKREKFLAPDELARLGAALETAQKDHLVGPYALAAIRLLIFTGARLSEILTLEWVHVDLDRRIVFLPDSKTGRKPLTLNDSAIDVFKAIPRFANNPYVIVGHRHGTHLVNLQRPWQIVRKIANIDCRIHDLRHTFASIAVANGGSLPILGRQLGHSNPATTNRYAHLADDPVRKLTQQTGEILSKALRGKSV